MSAGADYRGNEPSKTQLDKLGDRLREGSREAADLRTLDDYRRSFRLAYDTVANAVREDLRLEGTGRPAKTTAAIAEKLNRQKVRLTQIQDIAGFRIVVDDVLEQDRVVGLLAARFAVVSVDDRRLKPSHGYRAVHVIASIEHRVVEIQVRTREQHLWAELSEKQSDIVDPSIKYGGGPEAIRNSLLKHSQLVADLEDYQRDDAVRAARVLELEKERSIVDPQDPSAKRSVELIDEYTLIHQRLERNTREIREEIARILSVGYNGPSES